MSDAPSFTIRQATRDDLAFVLDSWVKSYAKTATEAVSSAVYWDTYPKLVKAALSRSSVIIACPGDDPESILGWACVERVGKTGILHYAYVKHPFRRLGIASKMLGSLRNVELTYTHKTPVVEKLGLPSSWVFNPYPGFRPIPALSRAQPDAAGSPSGLN